MVGQLIINVLSAEITAGPLARGYTGMNDQAVADSLNTANRAADAAQGALFNYLARNRAKDIATEPDSTHILGRLRRVVEEGVIGSKTFDPGTNASVLSAAGKDACFTLLRIAEADRLGSFAESTVAPTFAILCQLVVDTGVMKPADKTNLIALSENRQSRAAELGLPKVKVGWVTLTRA